LREAGIIARPMSSERSGLLRAVGSISIATAMSRVLGLVREQVMAFYFGAGLVTDAFVAAFRIPNLLRDLFAEGALSAAFVPTFTGEQERSGRQAAWDLGNRVIGALLAILVPLTLVIFFAAPWIMRVWAPGFDEEKLALSVTMTRIVAPFLLFVALAAVAMGMLNVCNRFFLPALAPVFFNVASIAGVVTLVPLFAAVGIHPGLALAVGAIVGGALQFLVQVPVLGKEGFRFRPRVVPSDPGLRRIGRLMLPATFGLAATQINILVDTVLASRFEGAITWLQYAFRLLLLPIGLFGVSIATANLARVSRAAARGDRAALRSDFATSLRAAALLTLPATAGLIALREPIVRVLFQHGRFDAHATTQTAAAVLCYTAGLYAYAVTKIQVPTYYALGETRRPVAASAIAVTLKVGASLTLIAALPALGIDAFLGLALSTSIAAWTNFAILSGGLRWRLGSLREFAVASTTLRVAAVSALMGVACHFVHRLLESALGRASLAAEIVSLGSTVAIGIAIFVVAVRMLRVPEAQLLWDRLRRKEIR